MPWYKFWKRSGPAGIPNEDYQQCENDDEAKSNVEQWASEVGGGFNSHYTYGYEHVELPPQVWLDGKIKAAKRHLTYVQEELNDLLRLQSQLIKPGFIKMRKCPVCYGKGKEYNYVHKKNKHMWVKCHECKGKKEIEVNVYEEAIREDQEKIDLLRGHMYQLAEEACKEFPNKKIKQYKVDPYPSKIKDFSKLIHRIGSWYCPKSPFGICAYDPYNDPALDGCLYCGQPHERK